MIELADELFIPPKQEELDEEAERQRRKQRCKSCYGRGWYVAFDDVPNECRSCHGRGWMPKRPKRIPSTSRSEQG